MHNLLSYCGLVEARKSASEKDSPILEPFVYEKSFVVYLLSHLVNECTFWALTQFRPSFNRY